ASATPPLAARVETRRHRSRARRGGQPRQRLPRHRSRPVPRGGSCRGGHGRTVDEASDTRDPRRRGYARRVTALGDLDRDRIGSLHAAELDRFHRSHPRTLALLERARDHMPNATPMAWMASDNDVPVYVDRGSGAGFTDVDGEHYLDFNASDM